MTDTDTTVDALKTVLGDAGFTDSDITPRDDTDSFTREWADDYGPSDYLVSATVEARKSERHAGSATFPSRTLMCHPDPLPLSHVAALRPRAGFGVLATRLGT